MILYTLQLFLRILYVLPLLLLPKFLRFPTPSPPGLKLLWSFWKVVFCVFL